MALRYLDLSESEQVILSNVMLTCLDLNRGISYVNRGQLSLRILSMFDAFIVNNPKMTVTYEHHITGELVCNNTPGYSLKQDLTPEEQLKYNQYLLNAQIVMIMTTRDKQNSFIQARSYEALPESLKAYFEQDHQYTHHYVFKPLDQQPDLDLEAMIVDV